MSEKTRKLAKRRGIRGKKDREKVARVKERKNKNS
jgi:hypothetical protein